MMSLYSFFSAIELGLIYSLMVLGLFISYRILNIPDLTVDGSFGSKTEQAVRQFQTQNNLTADGKVGQNTWNALYNRYIQNHSSAEQYPGIAMRNGQAGATVKSAQQRLNLKGATLSADGKFGSKTTTAVRNFQSINGLSVDGVIGQNTWAKLYA